MARTAYPTAGDLQVLLTASGVLLDLSAGGLIYLDLEGAVTAARQQFEELTGRTFLAYSQARRYDSPVNLRGILDLRADLLSLESVTAGGTALVSGRDFVLGPANADLNGRPWSWIEFIQLFRSGLSPQIRQDIRVTGSWGYSAQVPEDVWQAILAGAAARVAPQIALGISRGLLLWREGDVMEEYGRTPGTTPLVAEAGMWVTQFGAAAARYRRVAV